MEEAYERPLHQNCPLDHRGGFRSSLVNTASSRCSSGQRCYTHNSNSVQPPCEYGSRPPQAAANRPIHPAIFPECEFRHQVATAEVVVPIEENRSLIGLSTLSRSACLCSCIGLRWAAREFDAGHAVQRSGLWRRLEQRQDQDRLSANSRRYTKMLGHPPMASI
jgi:hypothetical protein